MLGTRKTLAEYAQQTWDVIVIGGGITGAGIAVEVARSNKSCLLLEQRDFAWGTSSRSSKMVHGGLRYLAQGHLRLTSDALRERERMLRELPELVIRQPYAFVVRKGQFPGRWAMKAVLWLYDRLAKVRDHYWLGVESLSKRLPGIDSDALQGAMYYHDALTDDSRLVLRILHEAVAEGAQLVNYMQVQSVEQIGNGLCEIGVTDVADLDVMSWDTQTLKARKVINATGAWCDEFSQAEPRIRPQRGSHIAIPRDKLPIDDCMTVLHPEDKRPLFIYPWQGITMIGTTDLDHKVSLSAEPFCEQVEVDYILKAVDRQFPNAAIKSSDILSTHSGVRPIVASGKGLDPSKESREHAVWQSGAVVTVSGGKLTTFRLIALDAVRAANVIDQQEWGRRRDNKERYFRASLFSPPGLGHPTAAPPEGEALLSAIDWVLSNEFVQHLDDLLLRRVRLGIVAPDVIVNIVDDLKDLCMRHLGWDEECWSEEFERYQQIIECYYRLPQ